MCLLQRGVVFCLGEAVIFIVIVMALFAVGVPHCSEQHEEKSRNKTILLQPPVLPLKKKKLLYIVTSSTEYKFQQDRLLGLVVPVVKESLESLRESFDVQLYLILGYPLRPEREMLLRQHVSFKMDIWDDAAPFQYKDDRFDSNTTNIVPLLRALTRQHRFVLKDKLWEYDLFAAMEDDMLLKCHHVEYHLEWSLRSLRPGFLRVEVLPADVAPHSSSSSSAAPYSMDASLCCQRQQHSHNSRIAVPDARQILLWETSVSSIRVERLNSIATARRCVGYLPTEYKGVGQSAGYIATRQEAADLVLRRCPAFLPPFDSLRQDGLWLHGTEYWSGSLQLWVDCRVERLLDIYNFSRHLIYHTTNNKQKVKTGGSRVSANTLMNQLIALCDKK